MSGTATSGTTLRAAAVPLPDGYPAEAFRVPAPLLFVGSGGVPGPDLPPCSAAEVAGKAATVRTADGLDGVIQLDGASCSLNITAGPTSLLDADGHRLDIGLDAVSPTVNPPMNEDADLATGHILWGFAVHGSWCGTAPAFVDVQMTADLSTGRWTYITVPLTGAAPVCRGRSDAMLQPGVDGNTATTVGPAEPVLPAPADWAGLHVTLHVDPVTTGASLTGLSATISNPTGSPISLSPCPSYQLVITQGNGDTVTGGALGCSDPEVLAAGGSVSYPVASPPVDNGSQVAPAPGAPVTIQLAIAAVATATATARVG